MAYALLEISTFSAIAARAQALRPYENRYKTIPKRKGGPDIRPPFPLYSVTVRSNPAQPLPKECFKLNLEFITLEGHVNRGFQKSQLVAAVMP